MGAASKQASKEKVGRKEHGADGPSSNKSFLLHLMIGSRVEAMEAAAVHISTFSTVHAVPIMRVGYSVNSKQ